MPSKTDRTEHRLPSQPTHAHACQRCRPDRIKRQERIIMEQAVGILTIASDIVAMAAAVATLIDLALRRSADRIRKHS